MMAQKTHRVTGKITDEKGKGLPGANVVILGTGLGASTDLSGSYTVNNVPSGTYQFKVSMIGYESTSQDVTVVSDQEISFRLLPKAYEAQPVVVTASRTRQKLQDSPVTTSVVQAEQIAERNFISADEAVRNVGGVSINGDQVSIRNSTGYAHGVGSRVLVMIDGVPVLSGDTGEIKWDALPIGQLEQMEVVKSAGSALYGSNAMGGVINFITKNPEDKASYKITSEVGMWDDPAYEAWEWTDEIRHFHRLGVEHTRTMGDWSLLVTAEEKQNQSFRQNDDFSRGQVYTKVTRNLNGASSLSFMLNGAYEDRGSPLEWDSQSSVLTIDSLKLNDRVYSSKLQANSVYQGSSDGGKQNWSVKAHYNYNEWHTRLYNDNSGDLDKHYSKSTSSGVDAQLTLHPFEDHRLTTGCDITYNSTEATMFGNNGGMGGAVYIQDEINSFNPLVATVGLRGDIFHVRKNEDIEYEGETYGQFNPKLGLVYHASNNFAFRGNVGTGFRIPTLAELFSEMNTSVVKVKPNPYLQAEQAYSAETGFNYFRGKQMIDVAIFNNWYTNMIEPMPTVANQVQFMNIKDANIFGVETSLKWNLGQVTESIFSPTVTGLLSTTDMNFHYMYTSAVNLDEDAEEKELPYRPAHSVMFSTGIDYWKHGRLNLDARYKSAFNLGLYNDDPVVDQRVIDIGHNLHFDKWAFQLKVSNLLNWNYVEIDRNLAPIRSYSASIVLDI